MSSGSRPELRKPRRLTERELADLVDLVDNGPLGGDSPSESELVARGFAERTETGLLSATLRGVALVAVANLFRGDGT